MSSGGDDGLTPGDAAGQPRPAAAPILRALSLVGPSVKQVVEGALMAAGGPLTPQQILALYADEERPALADVQAAIAELADDYNDRGIELAEVAGGWRIQVRRDVAPWVGRLWEEKPARYSRALLETLALIAYRQPITRGEIEDIRGVTVSTQIVKTLTEREWIRVVGHRDVPGRPALYATTRRFLDYFGLRSLNDLPTLAEIRDPDFLGGELDLVGGGPADPDAPPGIKVALAAAETPPAPAADPAAASGDAAADTGTVARPHQPGDDRDDPPA